MKVALLVLVLAATVSGFDPTLDSYLNTEVDDNTEQHGQLPGSKSTNCSCGWTNKARIVGGRQASVNEFPLMAALKAARRSHIFCGGSILTGRHVLTAAHCTYFLGLVKKINLVIIVGEHDQSITDEANSEEIPVTRIIGHEKYHPISFLNDISLVVLGYAIKFGQTVGPVCLPTSSANYLNEQVKVIGWGRKSSNGAASNVLLKLNMRVVRLEICRENFDRTISTENPTQLCTLRQNKDSCEGDSGGPLLWLDPDTNRYTLVGLISYGKTLCATGPAVNTDISAYLDWIQRHIAATHPEELTCSRID